MDSHLITGTQQLMRFFISLLMVILLFPSLSSGEDNEKQYSLKGNVSDHSTREMLTGVNVYLKGTITGTVTNERGFYSLEIPEGNQTITFSFIGYKTLEKEVNINDDRILNILLEPSEELLGEIQITAQRRFFGNMEYGRELPSINAEAISKQNSGNASDILHARVAGVWATKTSGAPGDQQKIRIRGQASFFSSAEPLYVIDGVPVPIVNLASLGIADLNIHDIENVTILKDASSSSLYGYQGGNGVILIDTKQAKENRIDFTIKTGLQWFDNFYDLMDTKDYIESLELAKDNIKSWVWYFCPTYSDTLCSHDRQDEIFKNGIVQEYQLSGSGIKNFFKYYLSGNYTRHGGILTGSLYERATAAARIGRNFGSKLALNLSYRGSYQNNKNNQNEYNGNRLIFEGINKSPCLECTPDSLIYFPNPPPVINKRIHFDYRILNDPELLQSIIDDNQHQLLISSHSLSLMGRYQISHHWNIDLMESAMYRKSVYSSQSEYYDFFSKLYPSKGNVDFLSDEEVRLLNHQINLSYNNNFGLHEMEFLLAHRVYADNLSWEVDSLNNTLPEHYYLRNSMAGYGMKGSVIRQMSSYIAHVSYNFRNTYFFSAIANLSRLKEGVSIDYYTLFPSLSLSWNIANEPFLSTTSWLDELNFYTNYGVSGNYPLNGLSNDLYGYVPYSSGGEGYKDAPYVDQFANHFLKHENTQELDLGLKSSFFNGRFKLNAAWYTKKIDDQIIQRDIPLYYGGGKIFINLGDIEVKGYEMGFEAVPVQTKDFSCYVKGNFSSSEQVVTRLADGQDMLFYSADVLFPEFIVKEGEALGNIYGYKYLGKWKEEYEGNKLYYNDVGSAFLNIDTTFRKLNEDDKVVIGNSVPDFTWNLSGSLQYKNFSLDFTLYSVWGVDKFNATRASTILTGVNRDAIPFYADSVTAMRYNAFYESSLFIDNASFIRLKTVTLGYEPEKKLWGIGLSFSLSFENLLTITNYRGYDPEATIFTDNNFSDNAIDKGAYPNPKGVFATVNMKF
ncbi:MAG: SusC/RagA family TonB-linked outer membrane protein [Prolixibacteraceae bacterium]|nr:SusC/RagA family TonB-linked outer membrane protein [Prolixibacteraceae bacterium]